MSSTSIDRVLLVTAVLCLLAAPWSWIDDGITPSWIVFPVFLLIGLWRLRRGRGRLWLAVTASVFVLVHVPWTFAAVSGDRNPVDADGPFNPEQWLVTLLALPAATAIAGWLAWRATRAADVA